MYGRGNYTSSMGQGLYASAPTSQRHPHAPQPAAVQNVSLPVPPHGGQVGHPAYQHAPPGPPQPVAPFPSPVSGISTTQPYLTPVHPPPPLQSLQMHGTSQMHQRSQWSQNTHFVPPALPSLAPTVLTPPLPQGQTAYGNEGHQQPAGGMKAPPPPHPPVLSFCASSPIGSFGHSVPQNSNKPDVGPPPLPPPPLPSSPLISPPLPPSSPPPTSSSSFSRGQMPKSIPPKSCSANFLQSGSSVSKVSEFDKSASGYVKEVSASCLVGDNASTCDGSSWKHDGETGSKMGSPHVENLSLDLTPRPPKPVDDRIVRNIEILCRFIAKNGPEFEDLTRKKEFGNPEFRFLFGCDPGSEDAVAHEYFVWMRNKFQLESKSLGMQGRNDSSEKSFGGSSSRLDMTVNNGVPCSPADSDMDMEDDITQPDEEPKLCSTNNLSNETFPVAGDVGPNNQLQLSHSTAESMLGIAGNVTHTQSLGIEEQMIGSETSSHQNQSIIRKSLDQDDRSVVNSFRDSGRPLNSNLYDSSSSHEDLSKDGASIDLAESRLQKLPSQLVKRASPFRLLQEYASEGSSDGEACHEDVGPVTVSSSIESGSTTHNTETGGNLGTGFGPKNLLVSAKVVEQLPESCKSDDISVKPVNLTMEADMMSASRRSEDFIDNVCRSQEPVTDSLSHGELQPINASRNADIDLTADGKKDAKIMSAALKVDEFGRLIKEGGSDSDSGGSPRYRRRRGKRGRSRSRSRSPHRWRRRSPGRRRERRGRSRSFSPKRHRSRSKSPPSRHEYPGDKMRRDKGQLPECFDFLRGKCHRGSHCRYLHRQDKSDRSRSDRSKQQLQELPPSSRSSGYYRKTETIPDKKLGHEHGKGRTQEPSPLDMACIKEKKLPDGADAGLPDGRGDLEASFLHDADTAKLPSDADHVAISIENVEQQQSKSHSSDQIFRKPDHEHERPDNSSASEASHIQTSSHVPSQIPVDKFNLSKDSSSQIYGSLNSTNISFSSENIPSQSMAPQESIPPVSDHLPLLPPSAFPFLPQDASVKPTQQLPGDYSVMSPAEKFSSHPASMENFPAYQVSISYPHAHFPFPPNSTWNSIPAPPAQTHPPCPPFINNMTGALTNGQYGGHPVHFQQNMIPPRNDLSAQTSAKPSITEFQMLSHVSQNQAYPLLQEPDRPSSRLDDHRPGMYSTNQPTGQPHGVPGLVGEVHFAARPLQGSHPPSSYAQENLLSQAAPFSRDSPSKSLQAFCSENPHPADGVSSLLGKDGKISSTLLRYTSDILDWNQQSHLSEFGGSRIPNHFNPYASTFDRPLSSKFSSNKFDAAHGLSHATVEGRGIGSLGSRIMISAQNSAHAVEASLPRLSGDEYDPLYDSIEPSSKSLTKSVLGCEEIGESDVMLRLSGSNRPMDVEETNKQKGTGAVALTASLENEEYGETADAEVGAVENGSPSNLNDATDGAAEEFEIDQVKAPGESKKSKDSRSMKLFKVALASFVKDVLKPSWRQGNMSKEAFKTIVKKTVDKVSGAMKRHQIPKSQAKIDHYIDSSQRKLTKLVMGYVDKYVKA